MTINHNKANIDMSSTNRDGETGSVPVRHGRFLVRDAYWYYTTREGLEIGPFDSEEEAEAGVGEFIDFICEADPDMVKKIEAYRARAA